MLYLILCGVFCNCGSLYSAEAFGRACLPSYQMQATSNKYKLYPCSRSFIWLIAHTTYLHAANHHVPLYRKQHTPPKASCYNLCGTHADQTEMTLQSPDSYAALQDLHKSLTHLGNGLALLYTLDNTLMTHRSVPSFMAAAPLLGIAPDDSRTLCRPVSHAMHVS